MNSDSDLTYTYLLCDKAVDDDHDYNNDLTKNITIEEMFSSDYPSYEGKKAITEFNKFADVTKIPDDLDFDIYKISMFYFKKKDKHSK